VFVISLLDKLVVLHKLVDKGFHQWCSEAGACRNVVLSLFHRAPLSLNIFSFSYNYDAIIVFKTLSSVWAYIFVI